MIYWFDIAFSIPLPLPTPGMVAAWLMVGNLVLVWTAASTAFNRKKGYTPSVLRDGAVMGLFCTGLVVILWPLVLYFQIREVVRKRGLV